MFNINPAPTRFDLNFRIGNVPVRVHPLFWLLPIVLAGVRNLTFTLVWVVAVFVSILLHELGHSAAMHLYGFRSRIVLYLFGGVAIQESGWGGGQRSNMEQIVISFAGPLAGFLFAALILILTKLAGGVVSYSFLLWIIPIPTAGFFQAPAVVNMLIGALLSINIFWGLINLLPVFPLDGGQIARAIFIQRDPWDGFRKSLWLSVITGALLALIGFAVWRSLYMAFLFGFLAFQSYQMLQGGSSVGRF